MIPVEDLISLNKNDIPQTAQTLNPDDLRQLVNWLEEKDDNIRYHSLLLLLNRSQHHADVYPYWDVLAEKLSNPNSYQRSIGLMLLAENARWDTSNKLDGVIDAILSHCDDEKPVTVRQCVQSLVKIVPYKTHLAEKITTKLLSIDLQQRKETQQKILLMDILSVFAVIRKIAPNEKLELFIVAAITGEILDKKAKAEIEKLLS